MYTTSTAIDSKGDLQALASCLTSIARPKIQRRQRLSPEAHETAISARSSVTQRNVYETEANIVMTLSTKKPSRQ